MKRASRIGLLVMMVGLLWHSIAPASAQTPQTPHLVYGQSLELRLVDGTQTYLWLDVTQGDVFTVNVQSNARFAVELYVKPTDTESPLAQRQTDTAGAIVYSPDQPGPYLLSLFGNGPVTVSLIQGDSVTVDRGPIAFGDTVTGTGAALQLDVYSIDLPPNSAFTLRITGEDQDSNPALRVRDPLRDFLVVDFDQYHNPLIMDHYDNGTYTQYYEFTAEQAGPHQIVVGMDDGEPYTLTLMEGDDLSLDKGSLGLDTPVSNMGTAGKLDRYTVEATPGDVLTFLINPASPRNLTIRTSWFWAWGDSGWNDGEYFQTTYLNSDGPYYLYVQTDADYTLTMINGPYLQEVPVVHVGDSLEISDPESSTYALDANEGQWITLQTTASEGTNSYRADLDNAAGKPIDPIVDSRDDTKGIYKALFYLHGPAPYFIKIYADADFTLSVVSGDTLRMQAGEIAVGQSVEGSAAVPETVVYTFPTVEAGQAIAVVNSVGSQLSLFDAHAQMVKPIYENPNPDDSSDSPTTYAVYQLGGLCPCQLQLTTIEAHYTLQVVPVAPDAFPAAQPLNLGEAVSGDAGTALVLPYTFEATPDGDLAIRLDFDPTLMDGSNPILEVLAPGDDDPRYRVVDPSQIETGEGYIVQHYPLYFSGEYTLRIMNLHGPYTLTAELR
ncbi:MAG: hypothetical protein BroJett018_25880 [Chloroflexota bacterium]|nr:MAG: hypothetical protein BroJett018_25880 [Chloroflexota bacterium]